MFRGPSILTMYAKEDDEPLVPERRRFSDSISQIESEDQEDESLHFDDDSAGSEDPKSQLMLGREDADKVLGGGTGSRKRSFVASRTNEKLPRAGPAPLRAYSEKRLPYFN